MSVKRKRLYRGIGNYVWGRCTAIEWRVWYLLVSAVRLSCLQSSGAIERLGGPQNTPQWHHNIVPGQLPAYWKTHGRNFFMPEIGAVRILLRKTLQRDAAHGRQATRPDATWCESAVRGNLQKHTHTHTARPTSQWSTESPRPGWNMTKWSEDSWGRVLDAIRMKRLTGQRGWDVRILNESTRESFHWLVSHDSSSLITQSTIHCTSLLYTAIPRTFFFSKNITYIYEILC